MSKPEFEFTQVDTVAFGPCTPPIEGLSEAILARDEEHGTVTRILKFEPGTDTGPNGALSHDFWEEVFIFEGGFVDTRINEEFRAGSWATRPPGMVHGPWYSEHGAKMFEVRYMRKE